MYLKSSQFLYWVIRLGAGKIRTVGGDGACVAIYELEGEKVCDGKKNINVVIHRDHTQILNKVVPLFNDIISIKEYGAKESDVLANQTILSSEDMVLVLLGQDPGVKWPDEDIFLKMPRTSFFTISLPEIAMSMTGINATNGPEVTKQGEIHFVNMKFDIDKKVIVLNSSHALKAQRKVKILDAETPNGGFDFRCISRYITGAIANKISDTMQFELVKPEGPAYVRYHATPAIQKDGLITQSKDDTVEQYTIFFAGFKSKK